MVLTLKKEPSLDNDYIEIKYRELTGPINQIIEICNQDKPILFGTIEDKKYPIDANDIFYIEWVDGYSCICTADNVYNSAQTLTQLEELLSGKGFVRISKPMLVNIHKVKWVSSALNMKLSAELINGERIAVSRRYRDDMLNKIYEMGRGVKQ